MNTHFASGPLDNALLFLSGTHRSDYYFQNPDSDDGVLRIRRGDQALWRHFDDHPIPENVLHFIRMAGFGGVVDCSFRKLDRCLITALVERWRPETHTFHLPIGEATVTLQDVNVLWGLALEGSVVSGVDCVLNNSQIVEKFYNLMGFELPVESIKYGNSISLTFILQLIKHDFPENPSQLQAVQRARLIILYLIGATLFPRSTSNSVHFNYLCHIEDLNQCATLSWGSAVLACLYRNLCRATNKDKQEVSGPMFLLQMWAWERFNVFAPQINHEVDLTKAYGARWCGPLSHVRTVSHALNACRSTLHSLADGMFDWTPYDAVLQYLPEYCTSGQDSWRCETYLIQWDIVEPHLPSRVLRQFGMFQPIPTSTLFTQQQHHAVHKISRFGGTLKNWIEEHNEFILSWINRHDNIITAAFTDSIIASQEYMQWYLPRTMIYTLDPRQHHQRGFPNDGGTLRMTWDAMSQIYQQSREHSIRNLASQAMTYGNAHHHMGYQPTHMTEEPVVYQVPPVTQSVRRRRNRGQGVNAEREQSGLNMEQPGLNFEQPVEECYHPEFNYGENFDTQNNTGAGPSSYNMSHSPIYSHNFYMGEGSSNLNQQEEFLSPGSMMPFFPVLDTPPTPAFRNAQHTRPTRDQTTHLEIDTFDEYATESEEHANDNIANRRGRRQNIRRPGCGTH